MPDKEATARIKINRLLEAAGWRFFAEGAEPANILLESGVTVTRPALDALGENFERSSRGYVDFLLLDAKGAPLLVLEAKAADKNPLVGKEQARRYARSQHCRFVILSNGNLHYFWDLERGSPHLVTAFPTPASVSGYRQTTPAPQRLIDEPVGDDFIALSQRPHYAAEAGWRHAAERPGYIQAHQLRFLRPYQLQAIHALQAAVAEGRDRFLFEMATGTGKTLTAAAVIKLFLRSGNARRVLFLVDRLELEDQAKKAFAALLSADYHTVIYKESRDDWRRAEIVVTTVQSLLFNNKYQRLFSPTDFDLVISDEAHRSIGGNARAVFDFFIGYKLGLTATPRDYLRRFDAATADPRDPREAERRLLLDTYRTFGCDTSQPTFRYSLLDGVRICELAKPCAFNQDVKAMKPDTSVNATFLRVMLKQEEPQFRKILETAAHGTLKINSDDLSAITFPLPPLATQQAIVAEIEAEQALVAANRELIARFEQKSRPPSPASGVKIPLRHSEKMHDPATGSQRPACLALCLGRF